MSSADFLGEPGRITNTRTPLGHCYYGARRVITGLTPTLESSRNASQGDVGFYWPLAPINRVMTVGM